VTAPSAATIGCRFCAADSRLDDPNVVRCAQIATFVAAHRHPEGFAVSLMLPITAESESSRNIALDDLALNDSSDRTAS
jgi:hypothetical protein